MTATITNPETKTPIQTLMQVILHGKDMNTIVSFYRDKLGLTLLHPKNIKDFTNETWVPFDTGSCIFVLHGGGRLRAGEEPSHRLTFQVSDVKTAREQFTSRGVKLGEVRTPAPGHWVVDGRDPEDNVYALESES
ncbi:MAG TPA: VOC family protein [Candidatus Bathyarchaeia archaeon]|nr:VOC family protein [Candidatus Bathyarchaeia archaeon]